MKESEDLNLTSLPPKKPSHLEFSPSKAWITGRLYDQEHKRSGLWGSFLQNRGMDKRSRNLLAFGAIAWGAIGTLLQMKEVVDLVPNISPGWIYMTLGAIAAAGAYHFIAEGVEWIINARKKVAANEKKKNAFEGVPIARALEMVAHGSVYGETFVSGSLSSKEEITMRALEKAIRVGEITMAGISDTMHTHARINYKGITFISWKLNYTWDVQEFIVTTDDGFVWQQIMLNYFDLKRLYGLRL